MQQHATEGWAEGLVNTEKGLCTFLLATSTAGCHVPTKAGAQLPERSSSTLWFRSANSTVSQPGLKSCCQSPRELQQRGTHAEWFLEAATNSVTPQMSLETNWVNAFLLLWSQEASVISTLPRERVVPAS